MAIKVTSITFVKETDIQVRTPNTEFSQFVNQVHEALRKNGIPKGQQVSLKIAGAKKYTRYQLQKRLQKLGHKVQVRSGREDGVLYIGNANE